MAGLQDEADAVLARLRAAGTDLYDIEVKAAAGGLPKTVVDSVSAFANAHGGTIVLGLDEAAGFGRIAVDAAKLASDLAAACSDQLEPPIRPDIDIVEIDGGPVILAIVDELPIERKPCHVKARGLERGSFLRTHDGDRLLSTYEIHVLMAARGQPREDQAPVEGASPHDLDATLTSSLVTRLRSTRGPLFQDASDEEILRRLGVLIPGVEGRATVSLGGLIALGVYPQRFFPQLDVTFVAYPTSTGEPLADGTRFLDNLSIDGPVPLQVATTLAAVRRNMKRRSLVAGLGREDRWEYPEEVVREAVANALMHRDYHPLAQGAQVRVELYPDRLVVTSPGGLHGPVPLDALLSQTVSSSRNGLLAKLLEDVEVPGTGRTVCENRGSGLRAMAAMLRRAGMEPPELRDDVHSFRVTLRNEHLLDDPSIEWLASIDTSGISDSQRLALAYVRRHGRITNEQYRAVAGCDALRATRDLAALRDRKLLVKVDDRRWSSWRLASDVERRASLFDLPVGLTRPPVPFENRGRRGEVVELLRSGPRRASDIAESMDLSRPAALRWLHLLEQEGVVEPTIEGGRHPQNEWRLVQ